MPLRKKGGNGGGHGFLSPAVRRLLREYALEPSAVRGTGTRGRITRGDVVAAAAARWSSVPVTEASPRPWPSGPYSSDAPTNGAPAAASAALPGAPSVGATNGSAVEAPPPTEPPVADAPPPPTLPAPTLPVPEPPPLEPEAPPAPPVQWTPAPDPPTAPVESVPPVVGDDAPVFVEQPPFVADEPVAEAETLPRRAHHGDETVPFTAPRRAMAEHLVHSLQTTAHAFCAVEVDFQRLDRVRQATRDRWIREEGFGLSHLPFVARAVIDALGDFPRLNASIGTDELILRHKVHLGVAVEVEHHGLIVPVVRDAETKRLRGIARDAMDLTRRARDGTLRPEDTERGTFTITDPGPFGTLISVPIINHPEVAVLASEGVRRRPVIIRTPDGSDGFTVHPVGLIGLSFDHRAIETDYAAAFLDRVRIYLETRDWEQEL